MLKSNKVIAIILILFSALIYYQSMGIPEMSSHPRAIDSARVPQALAIILVVLSVILYIRRDVIKQPNEEKIKKDKYIYKILGKEKNVIFMLFIAIVYIILVILLGYIIATFIYLLIAIYFLGSKYINTIRAIFFLVLVSATITIGTYILFNKILNVFLP